MGSCDDAKALAEGQRAARSAIPDSKRLDDLMSWISALYPNRVGEIASRSKPRTKSAPAIRANKKTGTAYHSGQ